MHAVHLGLSNKKAYAFLLLSTVTSIYMQLHFSGERGKVLLYNSPCCLSFYNFATACNVTSQARCFTTALSNKKQNVTATLNISVLLDQLPQIVDQ